jgi:hypothetical protein
MILCVDKKKEITVKNIRQRGNCMIGCDSSQHISSLDQRDPSDQDMLSMNKPIQKLVVISLDEVFFTLTLNSRSNLLLLSTDRK